MERFIGPDATITLDFALNRLTNVVENMVVYPENMMKNLEKFNGLVFSQRVLLSLTQKNISREDSYSMVQRNSMKVWNEEGSFYDLIKADKEMLPLQPGDVPETYADMNDLVSEFGYKPEMDIRHGVANFVKWYKHYCSL